MGFSGGFMGDLIFNGGWVFVFFFTQIYLDAILVQESLAYGAATNSK